MIGSDGYMQQKDIPFWIGDNIDGTKSNLDTHFDTELTLPLNIIFIIIVFNIILNKILCP